MSSSVKEIMVRWQVSPAERQTRVDLELKGMGADLAWPALLRKLDRIASSYRD